MKKYRKTPLFVDFSSLSTFLIPPLRTASMRSGLLFLTLILSNFLYAEISAQADPAHAYIVSPKNNEIVSSPVTVVFGLNGMGVAPAGIERNNTGHHHLLINASKLPPLDQPLGSAVLHFGGGQTQTTLELEPGEHTLQLILGDHLHRPHNPPIVSEKITITVK